MTRPNIICALNRSLFKNETEQRNSVKVFMFMHENRVIAKINKIYVRKHEQFGQKGGGL